MRQRAASGKSHRQIELGDHIANDLTHAFHPAKRQPVNIGAPKENSGSAKSQGLENVWAGAHAAVEQNGDRAAHRAGDGWKRVQSGNRPIHLAAAMIRHDDPVHSMLDGESSVVRMQHTFQNDRELCPLAQKLKVRPGQSWVRVRLDKLGRRANRVLFRRSRQHGPEHWIGGILRDAFTKNEWEIGVFEIAWPPTKKSRIERNSDGLGAAGFRSLDEAGSEIVRYAPIELEPKRMPSHGFGNLFHRR